MADPMDAYAGLAPDQSNTSNVSTMDTPTAQTASSSYEGLEPDTAAQSQTQVQTQPAQSKETLAQQANFPNTPIYYYNDMGVRNASNEQMAEVPFDSNEVEHPLSPAVAAIRYSPLGIASKGFQIGVGGVGSVMNAVGQGYKDLLGNYYPQTALEAATGLEQTSENGLKDITSVGENFANKQYPLQGLAAGPTSWGDLVKNAPLVNKLPDDVKQELANTLGIPMEVMLDPMWEVGLFGKTALGEAAEKEGLLEPNMAKAGNAGHRALVTVGNKAVIKGQPVLNAVGAGQAALRKYFPGFHTMTDNPAFNKLAESTLKSPEGYAHHVADEVYGGLKNIISENEKLPINEQKTIINTEGYKPSEPIQRRINDRINEMVTRPENPESEAIYQQLKPILERRIPNMGGQPGEIGRVGEELEQKPSLNLNQRMAEYLEPSGSLAELPKDLTRASFASKIDKINDIHQAYLDQSDKVSDLIHPIDEARLNLMEQLGNESHADLSGNSEELNGIRNQMKSKSSAISALAQEAKTLKQRYSDLTLEHNTISAKDDLTRDDAKRLGAIEKESDAVQNRQKQIIKLNDSNLEDLHQLREAETLKQQERDALIENNGIRPGAKDAVQVNKLRDQLNAAKENASNEINKLDSLRQAKDAESNDLERMNQRLIGIQNHIEDQRSAIAQGYSLNDPNNPLSEFLPEYRPKTDQPFSPAITQALSDMQKSTRGMSYSEDFPPGENYLYHMGTPEWEKFKDKNLPELKNGIGTNAPKSSTIPASKSRINPQLAKNEVNNLASKGRLSEAFINPVFPKTIDKFTKNVFEDDLAKVQANRFLQNAKVVRVGDFMKQAEKYYGKTEERVRADDLAGKENPKDWQSVSSPHFENDTKMWFPKQIADFINGVQNPSQADMLQGWSKDWAKNASTFVKLVNFGLKPASAPFNYLSNLNLAYLNKGLSFKNVNKAFDIIAHDRMGTLGDKVALTLKDGTQLTEKQLMDLAHQHRGIGMGLEQSEIGRSAMPDILRDNPVSKKAMDVHMFAEDASRLPVFMTYLEKGFSPEAAAKATREALYDYSDLGKTDAKIAQYVPFYRFARLNMPRMISKMITDPARTFAVEKAREAWNKQNGEDQDERLLPDYIKGEEPWYAGRNDQGQPLWLQGGRYSTQNDINRPFGSADEYGEFHPGAGILRYMAGMVNPAFKFLPEEILNTNFAQNTAIARDLQANNGMGEEKEVLPGLNLPAKEWYAVNQISPPSMIRTLTDNSVPLAFRLLHELGGVNMTAQDLDQANLSHDITTKSDIQKLKNNLEYFKRKSAITDGKSKDQIEDDQINFDNALQEYQELRQKLLQGNDNE